MGMFVPVSFSICWWTFLLFNLDLIYSFISPTLLSRDDISNMPVLTMCLKESMRINTPVPTITRRIQQPLTFPDGRIAPAGNEDNLNTLVRMNKRVKPGLKLDLVQVKITLMKI